MEQRDESLGSERPCGQLPPFDGPGFEPGNSTFVTLLPIENRVPADPAVSYSDVQRMSSCFWCFAFRQPVSPTGTWSLRARQDSNLHFVISSLDNQSHPTRLS